MTEKIKTFINNHWLSIVSWIISIILAIVLFQLATENAKPMFYVDKVRTRVIDKLEMKNAPFIALNAKDSSEIKDDITVIRYKLCNEGRKILKKDNIKKTITIALEDSTCKIIFSKILKDKRGILRPSTEVYGNYSTKLAINFEQMEKGKDYIEGQLFFTGNPETNITVGGVILESDDVRLKEKIDNLLLHFLQRNISLSIIIYTIMIIGSTIYLTIKVYSRKIVRSAVEIALKENLETIISEKSSLQNLTSNYFNELLRRVRDIRTSERRFYQKINDIYATSIDYDPTTQITRNYFANVQNTLLCAITGKTAAEIIYERIDSGKPNLGLKSWRGEKVRKQDITIAKNYLTEDELKTLNNLVEQFIVYAEGQAMRRIPMHMVDWTSKLNGFMQQSGRNLQEHRGSISSDAAKMFAEVEYDKFNKIET